MTWSSKPEPKFKPGDKVRWDHDPMGLALVIDSGQPEWNSGTWWYPIMAFPNKVFAEEGLTPMTTVQHEVSKYTPGDKVTVGDDPAEQTIDQVYYLESQRTWLYTLKDVPVPFQVYREDELQKATQSPAEAIEERYGVTFVLRGDPFDHRPVSTLTEDQVVTLVKRVRTSALEDAQEAVRSTNTYMDTYDNPVAAIEDLKEQP